MASSSLQEFARQTRALTKKNLVLLATRHWISTLFQAVVIPVVFYALVLNINNFNQREAGFGVGEPRRIRSIQDSIPSTQQLVFVKPPNTGADIDAIIRTVSGPLDSDKFLVVEDKQEAQRRCEPNPRGVSGCYAVVGFIDSPLTPGLNRTWNYTLQFDSVRDDGSFNVHRDDNNLQIYQLPVQMAIDNAITNSTDVPDHFLYSRLEQEEVDAMDRARFMKSLVTTLCIVFYIGNIFGIYHAVGFITRERVEGVSQLIDAMGGGPASRVLASWLALAAVQSVSWIIAGALYAKLIFDGSNAAIFIFWQIFAGLSFLSASIFAAAFFRTRRISGIFAVACFSCLAGGAAILLNRKVTTAQVAPLSLFFPSMNYVFVLSQMGRYAMNAQPVSMAAAPVAIDRLSGGMMEDAFFLPVWAFWLMLIVQILVYPVLAVFAERYMHGISFKGRILSDTAIESSTTPNAAVHTEGLTKTYPTVWYKRLFGRNDGTGLTALDHLDLVAQPKQIVCLLGVNGAGKSTTLDLLSGFHTSTSGQMYINAQPSQLGVCPQKNILFDRLTVREHVQFWSQLKGGHEDAAALDALIEACDLVNKTNSQARTLSGGQKRKLQLACMFVGGTKICLMDEVTTGLDPLSRRTIWNIILAERSKRCMIFTTHFLDEGEVLADHIIILSKGHIKCQGTCSELKTRFGGGYRVSLPLSAPVPSTLPPYPRTTHQDQAVYRVPDSSSAAALVAALSTGGISSKIHVAGPTVEDVFLRVAQDDVAASSAPPSPSKEATAEESSLSEQKLTPGRPTSFFRQVIILLRKRFLILPRYWASTFLVLALPIACMPAINPFIAPNFQRPDCGGQQQVYSYARPLEISPMYSFGKEMPFGPVGWNQSLYEVMEKHPVGGGMNISSVGKEWDVYGSYGEWKKGMEPKKGFQGGVWMGDEERRATVGTMVGWQADEAMQLLRVYVGVRSKVPIAGAVERVNRWLSSVSFILDSWMYMLYACFILTVYPAFFALYPAFERLSNVRTLQLSNGVRPLPIWMAYFLYDLIFVVLISVAFTVTVTMQFPYWAGSSYMFLIVLLHGMCGAIISYIVSIRASSQLSSFLWSLFIAVLGYFGLALSYALPTLMTDALDFQRNTDIISYTLNLFFPIGSVFRSVAYGFNYAQIACRDNSGEAMPGDWWGYGFPITYLLIQVILLGVLLIWLDRNLTFAMFRIRRSSPPIPTPSSSDAEPPSSSDNKNLTAVQVSSDPSDLLRLSNVTKSFSSTPALSNLSLSLRHSEILALLGPNGAGKTTTVNLLRGELRPDSGEIYLNNRPLAESTNHHTIGVCPQFDALDLLTARQHLEFYARIHGVPRSLISQNTNIALARVGLTPHADKLASALSGGNKRKLSLAIALMGDPAVLILDEPSSAMDAAAKRQMWKVLEEEIAPGRSVLLTTHSMEEADRLATRAAILSEGRLLAEGTTRSLRERFSDEVGVELVLGSAPTSGREEMEALEKWVGEKFEGVRWEGVNVGGLVRFVVGTGGEKGTNVGKLIEVLEKNKKELGVVDFSIAAPTLERVFLSVVRDAWRGEEEERRRSAWRRFLGLE